MRKPGSRIFQATLERIDSPLKWVMVRVPFDAGKVWGMRGQVKVKGEINGFAFRTSLFPDGKGGHRLLVNKVMQRGAKAAPGWLRGSGWSLTQRHAWSPCPPNFAARFPSNVPSCAGSTPS